MMGRLPSLLQAASDGRGRRSRAVLEEGAAGAGELEVPPSSHPELHPAVASGRATLLEEESSDAGVGDAGSEAGVGDAGRASEGIAAAASVGHGGAPQTGSAQDGTYLREPNRREGV